MKTHYDCLEVPDTASPDEIRSAYRRLVKQYHPDHYPAGSDIFKQVTLAYDVLLDPERRCRYDRQIKSVNRKKLKHFLLKRFGYLYWNPSKNCLDRLTILDGEKNIWLLNILPQELSDEKLLVFEHPLRPDRLIHVPLQQTVPDGHKLLLKRQGNLKSDGTQADILLIINVLKPFATELSHQA